MPKSARNFFSPEQIEDIKLAILNAELDTSGEIRVHIENNCPGDVMDRSAAIFKKLGMHKTAQRNGVLIYLSVKNRKFAIIGDSGINAVVDKEYWERIKLRMLEAFRVEKFTEGLVNAIHEVGLSLKTTFPFNKDDKNELPDDLSFGDE